MSPDIESELRGLAVSRGQAMRTRSWARQNGFDDVEADAARLVESLDRAIKALHAEPAARR